MAFQKTDNPWVIPHHILFFGRKNLAAGLMYEGPAFAIAPSPSPSRHPHPRAPTPPPRPCLRAGVIGGGLGGLACCNALRKVGIEAEVFERAPKLSPQAGTGLALWPNCDGSILPRVELAATRTKEARCGYVTQKRPESGATLAVGRSYTQHAPTRHSTRLLLYIRLAELARTRAIIVFLSATTAENAMSLLSL